MNTNKKHLIGISTYAYPFACASGRDPHSDMNFTHLDLIDKAHEIGAGCVQFADNHPLDVLSDEELAALRKRAAEYGLVIEVGTWGFDRELISRYLKIADALGSRILRWVPGVHESDPVTIDDVAEMLSGFLPELREKDIILAVENHDKFTAVEHEELMRKLDDRHFGIVLDTTNSLSIEEPIDEIIEHTAKYCCCLHMKDYQINRANSGRGLLISGAALGEGRLDIPHVYEEVCRRSEYDFNVILESWMAPCDTPEETLVQEDEWAVNGVKYMQGLQ